jgi:hypothetical protein
MKIYSPEEIFNKVADCIEEPLAKFFIRLEDFGDVLESKYGNEEQLACSKNILCERPGYHRCPGATVLITTYTKRIKAS